LATVLERPKTSACTSTKNRVFNKFFENHTRIYLDSRVLYPQNT
jgi:hypothetical protein